MSLLTDSEIKELESLSGEFRWAVVDAETETVLEDFPDPCSARLAYQGAIERGVKGIEIRVLRVTVESVKTVDATTRFWFEMNFGNDAESEYRAFIRRATDYLLSR